MNKLNAIIGNDTLFVTGAYGRTYKTKEAVLKDWNNGKDFKIAHINGPYTSIRDVPLILEDYSHIKFISNTVSLELA